MPSEKQPLVAEGVWLGDNLERMRCIESGSVDLCYMDPPYNTGRDFGEFDDRWTDGMDGGSLDADGIAGTAYETHSQSMSVYLHFLQERLGEVRGVLKDTGSIFVHVDPTAGAYVKVLLDQVFGGGNFLNEIVWCYVRPSMGEMQRHFTKLHDTILWYAKDRGKHRFNSDEVRVPYKTPMTPRTQGTIGGGKRTEEQVAEWNARGRVPGDWWEDIGCEYKRPKHWTGYPTQKPLKLLERIVLAASNPGDLVLDPFCGSGTTLVAAKRHGRRYIGIDQSRTALGIARKRLDAEATLFDGAERERAVLRRAGVSD